MPEGKWVSKENLQTFWQSIRSNLTSLVTTEVNNILPPIIQEDVIDAYIPDILGNFAEVEDAPTATKNYAIGDYLVLNNHFYKVTAAITSGDTLVEGTNIERTNVGAEVIEIATNERYEITGAIGSITGTCYYSKSGHTVTFQSTLDITERSWTAYETLTLCTLPEGFRPITQTQVALPTNDRGACLRGIAAMSGKIMVYNPGGAITKSIIPFSFSFIV